VLIIGVLDGSHCHEANEEEKHGECLKGLKMWYLPEQSFLTKPGRSG
jgi:hypothetical protein